MSADWILHGLAKADAAIRKRTAARRLAQHVAPLTLHDAQVDVGAPRSAIAELTIETARAFSNALIRAARTFTAECGADGPAWIALNPQKGNIDRRPGWAEDERQRRLTAASRNEDTTG